MAKQKAKSKGPAEESQSRVVCRNRRARHDYEILDTLQCGIALTGSEVKSIRDNRISIDEAYARVEAGEVWLLNCDIAEYPNASVMNHERRRPRKLLLKRREIQKFAEAGSQQGQTLVPLEVYFTRGIVKVKLAVAKGRREYDKREKLKQQAAGKAIREALKKRM